MLSMQQPKPTKQMIIQEGKRYVTRNGDITGPLRSTTDVLPEHWLDYENKQLYCESDLVSEYDPDYFWYRRPKSEQTAQEETKEAEETAAVRKFAVQGHGGGAYPYKFTHDNLESAKTEALRLANFHTGDEFSVVEVLFRTSNEVKLNEVK